jgi:hypothetical protein
MKQALWFSLKVWLTGVLLGPLFAVFVAKPRDFNGIVGFIGLTIYLGFLVTIPCWLVLWAVIFFGKNLPYSIRIRRVIYSVVGVLLCISPFYLLFHADDNTTQVIPWAICYCIAITIGMWIYPLESEPVTSTDFS